MKKIVLLSTCAMAAFPATAFAQSTGTVATEEEVVVVTGTRLSNGVDGVVVPDTTKAKGVITQELIAKQAPGQTILNTINLIPSVNFTNSDPYGSSGGNIRIRGFDGNRISLTFDGVPLNDSGNYAIFSSQQLDPELIEQVNVGLGVTDVDSPTASAAGGTVNYRSVLPRDQMGFRVSGSIGDFDYRRIFGMVDTGKLTSFGTKAWVAGSFARNDKFKGPGKIEKKQFNARIYQPLGGGDFISLAGNYNSGRNNFYRNPSASDLRGVFAAKPQFGVVIPTTIDAANPYTIPNFNEQQQDQIFAFENFDSCTRDTPVNGTRQDDDRGGSGGQNIIANPSSCRNFYQLRVNPSDTGNIRAQSRFTLMDGMLLTIDPSFQVVQANGGGTSTLNENSRRAIGASTTATGVDFNGDGDTLDNVRFYTPNNTRTRRFGLTSSLIYDFSKQHRVRVAYTFDRARHRQTGEWGFLEADGAPESVFGGLEAEQVRDASGFGIGQRDRKSIALLNQISGQYIGKFFDNALRVEVGLRRPFFKRDLQTFCPIQATDGFAYCTSETILARGTPLVTQPSGTPDRGIPIFINQGDVIPSQSTGSIAAKYNFVYAPFKADYKFGRLLPNVGFTYNFTPAISMFGSYAKGFSAPRTDNLYRAPRVEVDPETTNAYDLGVRYTSRKVQAQGTVWKIDYANRIVSSFNQELGISIDRNVGKVKSWGIDGSVAYRPFKWMSALALASYIDAELKDNVEIGVARFATPQPALTGGLIYCDGAAPTATNTTVTTCAPTAGKRVTETPKFQYGGRLNFEFRDVEFGIQAKRVGSRFVTDVNDLKVNGYTLVDLDARLSMKGLGLERSYLQFNVQNLLNKFYFGNLSTQIRTSDNPNFSVGSPRTFMATLNVGL